MTLLTNLNHGANGNPHPQYQSSRVYQSSIDMTSNGDGWLKIFEINFASPDFHISETIQRMAFGFIVIDNASDNEYSIFEFNGYISVIGTDGRLKVSGTKDFKNRQYGSGNLNNINVYIYSLKNSDGSYNVKAYLYAPWKHKRLAIINPWSNIPQDRMAFTRTNVLSSKVAQFIKNDAIFSQYSNVVNISDTAKQSDINGYSQYIFSVKGEVTYSQPLTLSSGLTCTLGRIGLNVSLNINGGTVSSSTTNLGTLPSGYRPVGGSSLIAFSDDGTLFPLNISSSGVLTATKALNGGTSLKGTSNYVTNDAIPS